MTMPFLRYAPTAVLLALLPTFGAAQDQTAQLRSGEVLDRVDAGLEVLGHTRRPYLFRPLLCGS